MALLLPVVNHMNYDMCCITTCVAGFRWAVSQALQLMIAYWRESLKVNFQTIDWMPAETGKRYKYGK